MVFTIIVAVLPKEESEYSIFLLIWAGLPKWKILIQWQKCYEGRGSLTKTHRKQNLLLTNKLPLIPLIE